MPELTIVHKLQYRPIRNISIKLIPLEEIQISINMTTFNIINTINLLPFVVPNWNSRMLEIKHFFVNQKHHNITGATTKRVFTSWLHSSPASLLQLSADGGQFIDWLISCPDSPTWRSFHTACFGEQTLLSTQLWASDSKVLLYTFGQTEVDTRGF